MMQAARPLPARDRYLKEIEAGSLQAPPPSSSLSSLTTASTSTPTRHKRSHSTSSVTAPGRKEAVVSRFRSLLAPVRHRHYRVEPNSYLSTPTPSTTSRSGSTPPPPPPPRRSLDNPSSSTPLPASTSFRRPSKPTPPQQSAPVTSRPTPLGRSLPTPPPPPSARPPPRAPSPPTLSAPTPKPPPSSGFRTQVSASSSLNPPRPQLPTPPLSTTPPPSNRSRPSPPARPYTTDPRPGRPQPRPVPPISRAGASDPTLNSFPPLPPSPPPLPPPRLPLSSSSKPLFGSSARPTPASTARTSPPSIVKPSTTPSGKPPPPPPVTGKSSSTSSNIPPTVSSMSHDYGRLPPAPQIVQQSSQEVASLRDRCRRLEKALRDTQDLLRARDKEIDKLRRELDWMRSEQPPSQAMLRRQKSMDAGTWHRHQQASSLPNSVEQRARNAGLEAFLHKHDSWSGAEVVQAVQDLNAEVLQFSAAAAEMCASTVSRGNARPPASKIAQAIQDTASRLGAPFVRVLATREHANDPILVQFAIHACVSTAIQRFWLSFCPGLSAKYDALLAQIYVHMHVAEPQPTSSRWRSLTHKHIRTIFSGLEEHAINELTETILRWSADIFAISGYDGAQTLLASSLALKNRFGTQLRRISQTVCKLVRITREEIMSTSFECVMVEPGRAFGAGDMSDAFADSSHALATRGVPGSGQVLCTTEIGLLCTTRGSGGDGDTPTIERMLLLKPKVVLESVTRALEQQA